MLTNEGGSAGAKKEMGLPGHYDVGSLKYSFLRCWFLIICLGVEEAMVKPRAMVPGVGQDHRNNVCVLFVAGLELGRLTCGVLDAAMASQCYVYNSALGLSIPELKLEKCSQDEARAGYRDFLEMHKNDTDQQREKWEEAVGFLFDWYARPPGGGQPKESKDDDEEEVDDGPEEHVDDGDGPDGLPLEVLPGPQVSGEFPLFLNSCLQEHQKKAKCCCNDSKSTVKNGGDDDDDDGKAQVVEADARGRGDQVGCC